MHHHLNTLYQGQSLTRDAARDIPQIDVVEAG